MILTHLHTADVVYRTCSSRYADWRQTALPPLAATDCRSPVYWYFINIKRIRHPNRTESGTSFCWAIKDTHAKFETDKMNCSWDMHFRYSYTFVELEARINKRDLPISHKHDTNSWSYSFNKNTTRETRAANCGSERHLTIDVWQPGSHSPLCRGNVACCRAGRRIGQQSAWKSPGIHLQGKGQKGQTPLSMTNVSVILRFWRMLGNNITV